MKGHFDFPFKPDGNRHHLSTPTAVIKQALKDTRAYITNNPPISKTNKSGYIYYTRKDNSVLFEMLESCGFFDFHRSNKQKTIVMEHQVNKFVFGSGWKYYLRGYICTKETVEIHHLDGDVTNNNPRNLAYVTPQVNKLCAQACGLEYLGKVKKKMTETMAQAASIIAVSVKRTFKRLHKKVPNISALQWLLTLPHNLKRRADAKWQIPQSLLQQLH